MASYILTFDLGTTGNKAALIDETGRIRGACTAAYGVEYPRPDGPASRLRFHESCRAACRTLLVSTASNPARSRRWAVGTMNGCLAVDEGGAALYPHIIHADGRSTGQAARMEATGIDWYRLTGNRASARGTAAKVLWLKEREPDVYRRARWFLQTKDYVRGFLTGRWGAPDPSDGALAGMMDIANRRWAWDALAECGSTRQAARILPSIASPED
jgi:xylulokinase